jgi:hypothetical protein
MYRVKARRQEGGAVGHIKGDTAVTYSTAQLSGLANVPAVVALGCD